MDPLVLAIRVLGVTLIISGVIRILKPDIMVCWESSKMGMKLTGLILILSGFVLFCIKASQLPS
jgi:uncharacterized membrane protein HdeD (DUF308 family)